MQELLFDDTDTAPSSRSPILAGNLLVGNPSGSGSLLGESNVEESVMVEKTEVPS